MLATAPEIHHRIGSIVSGRVVKSTRFGVFVDIGLPFDAFLDLANMDNPESNGFPEINSWINAIVVSATPDGYARLSTRRDDVGEPRIKN